TSLLHGEAVAIGITQAAAISVRQGFCDRKSFERIEKLIKKIGLPSAIPADAALQQLIEAMEVDKKAAGRKIKFVMCEGIGKTRFHWLAPEEILAAICAQKPVKV
ncbi:MAG: 3-dehydroquinate synthase family protein, partial [Gammaproteobacteria bacterium]